jgi:hypothetical protein
MEASTRSYEERDEPFSDTYTGDSLSLNRPAGGLLVKCKAIKAFRQTAAEQ